LSSIGKPASNHILLKLEIRQKRRQNFAVGLPKREKEILCRQEKAPKQHIDLGLAEQYQNWALGFRFFSRKKSGKKKLEQKAKRKFCGNVGDKKVGSSFRIASF
jgi:hypothetical protein